MDYLLSFNDNAYIVSSISTELNAQNGMLIRMYDADEILDLVDMSDVVTGTVKRAEFYANMDAFRGLNLRAADLLIQNSKGELWIPRRTLDRKIAPGGLDYSCGGHVGSGETYERGLLREIEEELNLKLSEADLTFLANFGPRQGLPYFSEIYLYRSDKAPTYNPDDFSEYEWIMPDKLVERLSDGELAKSSMLETMASLLDVL